MKQILKLLFGLSLILTVDSCKKDIDANTETIVYGYVKDAVSGGVISGAKIYAQYYDKFIVAEIPFDSALTDINGYYELKFEGNPEYYYLYSIKAIHPISGKYGLDGPTIGAINKMNFELYP